MRRWHTAVDDDDAKVWDALAGTAKMGAKLQVL